MPRRAPPSAPAASKRNGVTPSLFTSDPLTELVYAVTDQVVEDRLAGIVKQSRGVERATQILKSKLLKSRASSSRTSIQKQAKENNSKKTGASGNSGTPKNLVGATSASSNDNTNTNTGNVSSMQQSSSPPARTQTPQQQQQQQQQQEQRRIRFADAERPASAAAGRTRPGPSVLKTPSRRRLQGVRPSSAHSNSRRKQPTPDGTYPEPRLPAPNPQLSPAEMIEMIQEAEDSRLNEELTTDVVGMLSPVQRQRYYSRPALNSRMRMSDYQVHRLNWAHPLRLNDAPRWDTSSTPLAAADFRADRTKSLGGHRPRVRSSALRRYHTGKAIVNYSSVVGKPTLPISEMKKPWNRVTKPATFRAATSAIKGKRKKYGYGTRVAPHGGYDLGRTLSYSDALGVLINRNESNANIATEGKKDAKSIRRERRIERNQTSAAKKNKATVKHARGSIISRRTSQQAHPHFGVQAGFIVPSENSDDKITYSTEYKEKQAERRRRRRGRQ